MDFYKDINVFFGSLGTNPQSGIIDLVGRDYYCLQYNHGGQITVQIDDQEPISVTGPSLLITCPGHRFRFGNNTGGSWLHNAMGFKGERVEQYIKSGLLPLKKMPPVFPIRDSDEFYKLFKQCIYYIYQGGKHNDRAAYLLEGMLLQLYEERLQGETENGLSWQLRQLSEDIHRNCEKAWDFNQEAESMHISYAHFRRVFKQITGSAPQNYLVQCRLSRASELLLSTPLSVKEIASGTGIDNIHYFTRIFRKRFTLPPAQFRKAHGVQQQFPESI